MLIRQVILGLCSFHSAASVEELLFFPDYLRQFMENGFWNSYWT